MEKKNNQNWCENLFIFCSWQTLNEKQKNKSIALPFPLQIETYILTKTLISCKVLPYIDLKIKLEIKSLL